MNRAMANNDRRGRRWSSLSCQIISGVLIEITLVTVILTGWFGVEVVVSVAAGILLVCLARILLALLSFALAWWFRSDPWARQPLSWADCVGLACREILGFLRLFFFYHAFEPLLNKHDPATRGAGTQEIPILLVHGFYANAGFWLPFKRYCHSRGAGLVYTLNLDPPFADIDELADQLASRVGEVCRHANAGKLVLVGHSMGGLVCRAFLAKHGGKNISQLVTLGSPHHGTYLAYILPGRNLRQMRPHSDWLRSLNAIQAGVPVTNCFSVHDNIIAPQRSARLAGAREIELEQLGHMSMAFSTQLMRIVFEVIENRPQKLDKPGL